MTIEAMTKFGWSVAGLASRLRKHHAEIPNLIQYAQAIAKIPLLGFKTISVTGSLVLEAISISQQHELMTGDALIVAVMRSQGITHLASADKDFDRVSGLLRYEPV